MFKVAIIGGGSTYTPELISGFLARREMLPVSEIWLMDTDEERLKTVGSFVQRMVAVQGSPFKIFLTGDRRAALKDAKYVITQFRVGQMEARREDEYLGKKHGLIGQETTGVGGMAKALRTIPVMMDIAEEIKELAPKALLLNFTNPSGLITEAVNRFTQNLSIVGVCNSAYTTMMTMLDYLSGRTGKQYDPARAQLFTLGLNHLTWNYGFTYDGEDIWDEIFVAYLSELRKMDEPTFDPDLINRMGMIPNYYLEYYYETERKLKAQENWPPSRAEEVMKIEEKLLGEYANPNRATPPEGLMQRGGAYYSTVATQLINAHHNDLGEIHVANVRHNGAVRGYEKEWVLELPCRVDSNGVEALPADPLPLSSYVLLDQVKQYEMLTVEAAVHGDKQAAYRALVVHPLGPSEEDAEAVLADMLKTNAAYLPQFKLKI